MHALITGGDGFVGEHLVAHLLRAGHQVTASSLSLPPIRTLLSAEQVRAVEWKVADVLDPDAAYRLIAAVRPDQIYHLAGFASGAEARQRPGEAVRVNVVGTVNLCEAVVAARRDFPGLDPRMLVMGSADAYGSPVEDAPLTEEAPLRPSNAYGLSKACQEMAAHAYRRGYGVGAVVARAFNLIGPGQRTSFVVPDFCRQVAAVAAGRSQGVEVGNLEVERDFTDVRDAVRALASILELSDPAAVYNVCSGRPVSVGTVLGWILDEAGVEVEVASDPRRTRGDEPLRIVGSPLRVERETGWKAERAVEETVRETYRWTARQAADGVEL
ncbi:MAG: GDP-mannose 4,6-dehydratase [Gemmatimonadota bacterium]